MFNNPFNSFHDTVAEAKEEREQLDRLLTISTPRERLIVVAIALFFLVLAAWLFFGSVTRSVAVQGLLTQPTGTPDDGNYSLVTRVLVEPDVAQHIEDGMPVRVEVLVAGGQVDTRGGTIVTMSAVRSSTDLGKSPSATPIAAYRIVIALDEYPDVGLLIGRACRVVIEYGRQSPIALFWVRRS